MRRWRYIPIACLFASVCALSGCGGESPTATHPAPPVRQVVGQDGPLRAELTVDRADITTSDRLTLTLSATPREGWTASAPDLSSALPENWKIVEQRTESAGEGAAGPRGWRLTATVEPFLDGEFAIGPVVIEARPQDADAQPAQVSTEPVRILVRSVIADENAGLAPVKTIVDPPAPDRRLWWIAGAGAAILLTALAWVLIARSRREPVVEPVRRPAHDIAIAQLDALLQAGLLERGAFKEFYAQASGILRRYIEHRFGLHAPNQTTEEFLAQARVSLALGNEDVDGLARFLRACDEVKFAAGDATRPQALAAAEAVRSFAQRTASAEAMVVVQSDEAVGVAA